LRYAFLALIALQSELGCWRRLDGGKPNGEAALSTLLSYLPVCHDVAIGSKQL